MRRRSATLMSSTEPDRLDGPNPKARRSPRPGEPSLRAQAFWGAAVLICGWLLVAVSGLCTAGYVNLAGGLRWNALLTFEGFFGTFAFLLMFGCIPIIGTIVMLIATTRAIRNRRRRP